MTLVQIFLKKIFQLITLIKQTNTVKNLIEAVAETDEDLMMKYLEGEEITNEELKAAIRRATINVEFFPVLCGSAFKNKGVQLMLDAVIDYLPSPLDIPAIKGINQIQTKKKNVQHLMMSICSSCLQDHD